MLHHLRPAQDDQSHRSDEIWWRASVKEEEGMTAEPSKSVVHLELQTDNLPRACAFYTRLFGWRVEKIDTGSGYYLALELSRGVDGGVVERDTRPALWLPYVEVSDVFQATERARSLGASVSLEPREGPAGWRSVVAAPAGAEIALWQPKGLMLRL
jgi:predicted enzyme related to lactoylglutathione lyase